MSGIDVAPGHDGGMAPISVLFVCTHNSARSIMAEALLREKGGDAYEACSAGTAAAQVRPFTLRVLQEAGVPTEGLHSKSIDEFMDRRFDFIITVCDGARQQCPVFPGGGERIHWGHDDPSAVEGSDEQRLAAYRHAFTAIGQRVDLFMDATDKRDTHDGD